MEYLLNIKEAAAFLNVSEMTVRRWTNDGFLKCYRVGGRHARRFNKQDLLTYVNGNAAKNDSDLEPLGIENHRVPDGSHITHLSVNSDDSLNAATAFIIQGFIGKESVLVVSPDAGIENIIDALEHRNVHVDHYRNTGRLHFSQGMDTPLGQSKFISHVASLSENRLRVYGDMTWTKVKGWGTKNLVDLEKNVGLKLIKNMLFLCQYQLDRFSGEEAMMAVETHSHHLYKGNLKENPYQNQ